MERRRPQWADGSIRARNGCGGGREVGVGVLRLRADKPAKQSPHMVLALTLRDTRRRSCPSNRTTARDVPTGSARYKRSVTHAQQRASRERSGYRPSCQSVHPPMPMKVLGSYQVIDHLRQRFNSVLPPRAISHDHVAAISFLQMVMLAAVRDVPALPLPQKL